MWFFRDHSDRLTTRALNSYRGDHRSFEYITSPLRISPIDLANTRFARPQILHFICSPTRASRILSEILITEGWFPTTIYEPIPDRCVPEELPALLNVLPYISILSPNAEEGLTLLSLPLPPTKVTIEQAAAKFQEFGVGKAGSGAVIVRSGAMGAYVLTKEGGGEWFGSYWTDSDNVIDVTGAGNSFLGGLAAGLVLTQGNVYEATLYANVSASFIIEQEGLPTTQTGEGDNFEAWNGDLPRRRLEELQRRRCGDR